MDRKSKALASESLTLKWDTAAQAESNTDWILLHLRNTTRAERKGDTTEFKNLTSYGLKILKRLAIQCGGTRVGMPRNTRPNYPDMGD